MHKDWQETTTIDELIDGLVANADGDDAFREDTRDVIERAIQIYVGDGWQLVPKEPTQAMFEAGDATFISGYTGTPTSDPATVWQAMLNAAPLPPNASEPEFRPKRMMHPTEPLMHVRCSACGARTWMTPEQWEQAERIRRRPNPAHGAPKPPGHNPVA